MCSIDKIPDLVKEFYSTVQKLETLFPNRKFTFDGHLVGSIGEVVAAYRYGLGHWGHVRNWWIFDDILRLNISFRMAS